MTQKYDVLSPDGFPITFEPFPSERAARKYIPKWCQRYEFQGYYCTSRWEHIPPAELPDRLSIVPLTVED